MIDTIILTLDQTEFSILPSYYGRFSPDITSFLTPPYAKFGSQKAMKAFCNPTKKDTFNGADYLPRLTLMKAVRAGAISTFLYVEFSAPKIVFNNNYDELRDSDFDYLCEQLSRRLRRYGVIVSRPSLKMAKVRAIHYSKNIILEDGRLASSIIREIAKSNTSTRQRTLDSKYRNGGEALHNYTNKWAIVAYDKIKELDLSKISEKGLFEYDNYCQLPLFKEHSLSRPFEVIRLEARYLDRPTIVSRLANAGVSISKHPTFCELFSASIAQTMLLHEINKIEQTMPQLRFADNRADRLLADLVVNNPRAHITTIMAALWLKDTLERHTSREVRVMLNANSSQWSTIMQRINSLNFTRYEHGGFATIKDCLNRFLPVKISNYKAS